LYAAGDLPGALREARAALSGGRDDPLLLRRACELALALRIPDEATSGAARLAAALPATAADAEMRAWWARESAALTAGARELEEREREVRAAAQRGRAVSLLIVVGVLGSLGVLTARR
jgi:hypothetical protein